MKYLPIIAVLALTACTSKPAQTAAQQAPTCEQLHPYGLPATVKDLQRNCDVGFESFMWVAGKIPLIAVEYVQPSDLIGTESQQATIIQDFSMGKDTPGAEAYMKLPYTPGFLASPKNHTTSRRAIKSAYQTSNIVPLDPIFARGAWAKLENDIRACIKEFGALTIVSGVLPSEEVTTTKLTVPLTMYKVILSPANYRAVMIDNRALSPVPTNFKRYDISLAELERRGALIAPNWKAKARTERGTLCSNL